MNFLLKDLASQKEFLEFNENKKVQKTSIIYLKDLCRKYYLHYKIPPEGEREKESGIYKGIMKSINQDYNLFESFVKYYIQIAKALTILGKPKKHPRDFNLIYLKNNLNSYIIAMKIINSREDSLDYLAIARLLEDKGEILE